MDLDDILRVDRCRAGLHKSLKHKSSAFSLKQGAEGAE